jgi:2-hydroxychromene-2-carboxylate isomerase
MKNADWYFDFISPYAYLQTHRLDELAAHANIRPKPVLFAGLLNHHGQLGPAEISPKREFVFRQSLWQAKGEGIDMKLPPAHPFKPLPPLRLAIALDCDLAAIRSIFDFIWREGRDVDDADEWAQLTKSLGVDDAAQTLSQEHIKQALRENTEEAIAKGVFGVPTLVVDNELFWGHDAADFFLDYLRDPATMESKVFKPVDNLAETAVQRKQQPKGKPGQ